MHRYVDERECWKELATDLFEVLLLDMRASLILEDRGNKDVLMLVALIIYSNCYH